MQQVSAGKAVTVQLETVQNVQGRTERESFTYTGELYNKEGTVHLIYKETENQTAHIRIDGTLAHIHRFGELSGDLWFVKGEQRDTRYETPYGRMILTVDTALLRWDPVGRRLEIHYRLLAGEELLSKNEIIMKIKEREKE